MSTGLPEGLRFSTSYRAFYTLSFNRDQTRGFNGSTSGDPRDVEWSNSGMPRHAIQLLGSMVVPRWFKVDAFGRITSGRSYTPMVSSDINGDGLSNDRAFVASQVAGAPKAARECLASQLGKIAARNSCTGPWTQSLNIAISPDAARTGLRDRGQISLVVTNVLGAADQLLHGANHLRNWGTTLTPDQTLLNVRGFDPATRAYRYDVNPSFGSTSASAIAGRLPFTIVLDMQLRLGPDRDAQQLKSFFRARAADGTTVLDATQIRARLDRDVQNNFADIARRATVLGLTPPQVAELGVLAKRFDTVRDSIYTESDVVSRVDEGRLPDAGREAPLALRLREHRPRVRRGGTARALDLERGTVFRALARRERVFRDGRGDVPAPHVVGELRRVDGADYGRGDRLSRRVCSYKTHTTAA